MMVLSRIANIKFYCYVEMMQRQNLRIFIQGLQRRQSYSTKQSTFLYSTGQLVTRTTQTKYPRILFTPIRQHLGRSFSSANQATSDTGTSGFNVSNSQNKQKSTPLKKFRPKLVIFDKYGTLIDFHSTWSPWLASFADRLEQQTGLKLKQELFEELDVCTFTQKARHGLLAQGTTVQIKSKVEDVLIQAGIPRTEAESVVEKFWCDRELEHTKPVHEDLEQLFKILKQNSVKIAMCTSSTREHTIRSMKKISLMPYIDKLLCCDDQHVQNRLNSVKVLCAELGIEPKDTVVIGDTRDDVEAGMMSQAGMTIGVLSGTGTRLDLAPYTNYIVNNVIDILPLIFPREASHSVVHRPVVSRLDPKGHRKASLVIFDKDGTLLCFHSMWTPWIRQMIERLEEETGLELQDKVLSELGFCHETNTWSPGIFAQGTDGQNRDVIIDKLKEGGLTEQKAQKALESVWVEADHTDSLKVLDNPTNLFRILKQFGVKIAICTADSRVNTEEFIKVLGVTDCVDMIVCGDDSDTVPKPSPHNALKICKALGVDPAEAIHVGDTTADIGMGVTAKLGATVGVLSGVGNVEHLDEGGADHIVPSIKHVLSIALNNETKEVREAVETHHKSIENENNGNEKDESVREK